MPAKKTELRWFSKNVSLVVLTLLATTAFSVQDTSNAMANYKNEMAACNNNASKNTREACIREAKKTLADYGGGADNYQQMLQNNRVQRCAVLKGDSYRDCESRMRGEGAIEGSVSEGGILRETITIVPVN